MAVTTENACVIAPVEGKRASRPILGWVLRLLISQVSVDPDWVKQMRDLSQKGTVVHVLLRLSLIEFLVLDQLCRIHDLPPIRLVAGAGRYALWPMRWLLRFVWRRCRPCETETVSALAEQGDASLLFLRSTPRRGAKRKITYAAEATEELVRYQREHEEPVFLVPHNVFWGRRRHHRTKENLWTWWIAQLREGPGILRLLGRVLRSRGSAVIRMGQPLDLRELVNKNPDEQDDELAQQARFTLRRRIEQARKVVLGPMAKSAEAIRDELLRNVALGDQLRDLAEEQGQSVKKVKKRARKLLREIMAVPKSGYIAVFNAVLWWAWSRIFDGVEIDEKGFAQWREVAHEGPLVIVSSHKSHVDYLILSQIFWDGGIFPPHIAAGRNLSFWPIGAVFRGCGAFFIRRHFLDDKIYVAVLQAYITKMLQEGYHLEFFIEGTRSRTGKMLPPKLGLLGMVLEAANRLKGYKVHIAPVSVLYGRVPEEGAHAAELEGGEKKHEDIGGLLRTRHTLGKRHGVLYVKFGTPIELGDYFREQGVVHGEALDQERRHHIIANLAYRTVHEINRVTVITPTALVATVLLLNRRRGITYDRLRAEVDLLARCLARFEAQFSSSLLGSGEKGVKEPVLRQATRFLSDANLVAVHETDGEDEIFTVASERRMALDYYKNSTLHPLVNALMVSASLGTTEAHGRAWEELAERVHFLSRLLKYEFTFRADAVFDVNLELAVEQLVGFGELCRKDNRVFPPNRAARSMIRTYAAMVENFVESYRIAVRQLRRVGDQVLSEKELIKATLAQGERMYLIGEVEHREARSKINFTNALRSLRDLGVLERREGRTLAVTADYREPEKLVKLEQRIVSYLNRAGTYQAARPIPPELS